MSEERRRILKMLAEGKVSTAEAEDLLDAAGGGPVRGANGAGTAKNPKYLRVLVAGNDTDEHAEKVDVRVPISLLRAGVRLAALLPAAAYGPVNDALKQNGIELDVSKVKPQDLEELVQDLSEVLVDVQGSQGEKVRVFCE
jgi:hypothetical protein